MKLFTENYWSELVKWKPKQQYYNKCRLLFEFMYLKYSRPNSVS